MTTLPQPLKKRMPQNARLGIKSSLSNIKSIVSFIYLLYVANGRKGKVDYSEEYSEGILTKIRLKDELKSSMNPLFAPGEIDSVVNSNPLFTSQIEHLQVGLELVFQLGKISFVDKKANSSERTGGSRFAKTITFSKNLIFLDVYFSALPEEKRNRVLSSWMKNEVSGTEVDTALYQMLTAFTENLKMSVDNGTENRTFEPEGIYEELLLGNTVIGKDAHEDVGPLRIFKSFVKEGMHPYISLNSNEFALRVNNEKLSNYLVLVSTALDLQNSDITQDFSVCNVGASVGDCLQKIYFGTPGSGKSYIVKQLVEPYKENTFRTTFHPDTDYASFVGAYKPVKDGNTLTYEFIPQAFTDAYVAAWKDTTKPVFLVIEEINRGNCAQIFGDLFQLLDRGDNGKSEYSVKADKDLCKFLESNKGLGKDHEGIKDGELCLPSNLHIYATMNTSDQSLFPMDSAFKRRWEWEYVPIDPDNPKSQYEITIADKKYAWKDFLIAANERVKEVSESEDKQMGNFFIKDNSDKDEFISKVMFYLWSEVCKEEYHARSFFHWKDGNNDEFSFNELFQTDSNGIKKDVALLQGFMNYLGVKEI